MPAKDIEARRDANRAYYARHRERISTKMRNLARQNRREAIAEAGGRCVWCPNTYKLQFDHIDCKTKVSHKIWTWSKAKRDAELAKCQLLCEPCHIQKTIDNNEHQWRTKPWDI